MECRQRLEDYFRANNVPFRSVTHAPVFSAQELAAVLHVPGKQVAKVVLARAGEALVMLVMPANKHVDSTRLATISGALDARLAREDEFSHLFSDCLPGAMPPFGNLYGVATFMDEALTDDPEIVFQAGTHSDAMRLRCVDYIKLVNPTIAQFTR